MMTPEEQEYIQSNKPERFFRLQVEILPAAIFNLANLKIDICHQGKYTGIFNADGTPNLDTTDTPLGTVVNLGELSEVIANSSNPENLSAACQLLFNEINAQATKKIEEARISIEENPESENIDSN